MACFDSRITLETIKEIAKRQPSYAVFCDAGLADDGTAASVEHIFNAYSPGTKVKVL